MTMKPWMIVIGLASLVNSVSLADEIAAEKYLKSRGLLHSGVYFLLADEEAVFKAIERLHPHGVEVKAAGEEYLGAKRNQKDYHDVVALESRLDSQIRKIDIHLGRIPTNPQTQLLRDELKNQKAELQLQLEEVRVAVRSLSLKQLPPHRLDFLYDQYKQMNLKYYAESKVAGQVYKNLRASYAKLASDSEVKAALTTYGQANMIRARLGPSKRLNDALNAVKAFEKAFPSLERKSRSSNSNPRGAGNR